MTIRYLLFIIAISCLCNYSLGQKKKGKKKKEKDKKEYRLLDNNSQQMVRTVDSAYHLHFNNINRIPYYKNEKALSLINKLRAEKDWDALYPLLENYVSNFGIENFSRDSRLLWTLARIAEEKGDAEKARLFYKLVLKHHDETMDISKILSHFDSLTINEKHYYVELEYYYELVEYRKEIDTLKPPRGVLLNMGSRLNSEVSDYGPTFSKDDKVLIFTSKRNEIDDGLSIRANEDLFFSYNSQGRWAKAEELEGVNSPYNEGSACLSKDHKTLIFTRCNSPNSMGNCDLFMAKLSADSTWGEVANLGSHINSVYWDSHPSFSHNEDTLYFASDRKGGFGQSDLYYTIKKQDGSWSSPLNMGPIINSRGSELSPFYHNQFEVLYYSSDGQLLNFGNFDIYKSYRKGLTWGEPKNVGPLVNGGESEYYFAIDSKSKDLYYAKSIGKDHENLDLHSFPLPMEAQPGANVNFEGSLTDELGEPFKGIVSIIDMDHGIEVAPKYLRPDGTFAFELIDHNNYLLIIQGDEFFRIEEIFYMDGDKELHTETEHISSKMHFESVEFENNKAEILPEMFGDLDKIINFMTDNPDYNLNISGHTDSKGNPDFNLKLSSDRASAIKDYLIHFGHIEDDRVKAQGFGSTKPIVDELSPDHERINRRVEFEIYKPGK